MKAIRAVRQIVSVVAPCVVFGALLFFVYYSLVIYQPTGHIACSSSAIARQTDVAVHVVRQWFGRESNLYQPCPSGNSGTTAQ